MLRRLLLVCLPIAALGALRISNGVVDRLAPRIADHLVTWTRALEPAKPTESEHAEDIVPSDVIASELVAVKPSKKRTPAAKPSTPTHAVHVSAQHVLKLAETRARPRAVPVAATAVHPAGLRLVGVEALGIGMKSGDILTQAGGAAATSVEEVVRVVLTLRARGAPAISGVFYRGNERWSLTVEQPYPPVPGAESR